MFASASELRDFAPLFWRGTLATVWIVSISLVVSIPLAVLLGSARRTTLKSVRIPLDVVVEGVRGIPIFVFMFWLFFALPGLNRDLQLSGIVAAAASLILYGTAWLSEVIRGVLEAIPTDQRDAAHAVHFGRLDTFRVVIFPQALPMLLPRLANYSIDMLKGSALMGFVGYQELTFWANQVRAQIADPFGPYLIALLVYFALAMVLSLFFRVLEALTPTARVERLLAVQRYGPKMRRMRGRLANLAGRAGAAAR